jgi:hypothetical protein
VGLQSSIEYLAYGWTKDHSYSTEHVTFNTTVAALLAPGQVLIGDSYASISKDDFIKRGSEMC